MHNPNRAATTLILGGARSGKSTFAEKLADAAAQPIYIATAQPACRERSDSVHRNDVPSLADLGGTFVIAETIARIDSPDQCGGGLFDFVVASYTGRTMLHRKANPW